MVDVVLLSTVDDPDQWRALLSRELPGLNLRLYAGDEVRDPESIEVALVWKPPPGALSRFPGLKLIHGLGHGVDYLFDDPELPAVVPIARLVDPALIAQMSEFVSALALWRHRRFDEYAELQRDACWHKLPPTRTSDTRVGILGLGAIGADIAGKLRALGFTVQGWSRGRAADRPKHLDGISCHSGPAGLSACLSVSDILVCVLPLTPDTRGILNAANLARLPRGAYLINIARGGHQVETDLIEALDSGHLSGAALDVFDTEPLPAEHPFWRHPGIRVTPHISGPTVAESAARLVAVNIRRVLSGQPPLHRVDIDRRY